MERAELERELERLHPENFGWALSCCGRDRDLAADVLQSAYVKILSGAARFGGRSTFRTWLFAVIRRTALAELRRGRRWRALEDSADSAPGADERMAEVDRCAELIAGLATLSARQREVLMLVFYHDLTLDQAAGVMGISAGSARTHYHRAKQLLLARLTEKARP
jgi:RNA polymerase sigma factor (sigma-70 family)